GSCSSTLLGLSVYMSLSSFSSDTAPTEIYSLSLHDALPIWRLLRVLLLRLGALPAGANWRMLSMTDTLTPSGELLGVCSAACDQDRKSTRLNSSHRTISYAVFCLKKKKNTTVIEPSVDTF